MEKFCKMVDFVWKNMCGLRAGWHLCYNRFMDYQPIILALIAALPTTASVVSTIYLNSQRRKDRIEQKREAERNAAKASIEQMITQDIIRAEVLHKLPENRNDIDEEYYTYHANGGNGKITRKVHEYREWHDRFAQQHNLEPINYEK